MISKFQVGDPSDGDYLFEDLFRTPAARRGSIFCSSMCCTYMKGLGVRFRRGESRRSTKGSRTPGPGSRERASLGTSAGEIDAIVPRSIEVAPRRAPRGRRRGRPARQGSGGHAARLGVRGGSRGASVFHVAAEHAAAAAPAPPERQVVARHRPRCGAIVAKVGSDPIRVCRC